jgi:hypothetical protein
MDEVELHVGDKKVGSATSAIDYHGSDRSAVSFQLAVRDHHDVETILTNHNLSWAKPPQARWRQAGHVEVRSFVDSHRQRLSRSPSGQGSRNSFALDGTCEKICERILY